MKKALRFLLILIVILFVGYLILCATSPATMTVERSTVINAPKAMVWNQMVNLKNWDNWSPWKSKDSTMVSTNTGPDGQPGDKNAWTSQNSGSGNMTIASVEGDKMMYDMHFLEPYDSKASGWVSVEEAEDGTKATWGFSTENPFMMRGFSSLFMKGMLEDDFTLGMKLLKEYIESGNAEMPGPVVMESTFSARKLATVRKTIPMSEMDAFFHEQMGALAEAAGDKINGNAHGIYYTWDEENGETDMAVGFAVSDDIAGKTMVDIPETKAVMVKHIGGYSSSYSAHMALGKYVMDNDLEYNMVIEEYVVGPGSEADTNKYVTNIYYLYK